MVQEAFFLATYDFLVKNYQLDKKQKEFLKHRTFSGNEIVANTRRLALMNMFLHNIGLGVKLASVSWGAR